MRSHKLPFGLSNFISSAPLELVHSDIWGPTPVTSSLGHRFYIHFIDDFSKFSWLYPLVHKSSAYNAFLKFKLLVENLFDKRIKYLQTNGGTEYIPFKSLFDANGIVHRVSCPYTPEQNGIAEQKHRRVVETGLTLMARAFVPSQLCDEAF